MDNLTVSCPHDNYFTFKDTLMSNNDQLYFITITARGKRTDLKAFKDNLTEVLEYTNYPSRLRGVIEYSDKTNGFHFHGFTHWKYKHLNPEKTGFYARVEKIKENTLQFVLRYISKTFG